MGGGLRLGHAPARLLGAGLLAAVVLSILGTAAVAAQGAIGPGQAAPAAPPLVRVAAPQPIPAGVVTPLPQPKPPVPKKRAAVKPSTTTTPTSTTTTLPQPPPPPPTIPQGKGMWIWKPEQVEHGNVAAQIARAKAVGLTHVFVRTGSTWDGIQNLAYLDQLLPAAHAAGLKVYGWDFPKLAAPPDDVARAMTAISHVAPGDNRLDGFASDIETPTEGTQFTAAAAQAYGAGLRAAAGPSTLLVAVVPNPTPQMVEQYSYDAVVPAFDAVAPMVYWLNRDPGIDTAKAMLFLARYGKPLMPIGQAYDGGPEGGRPGVPPPGELNLFMATALKYNATAVSFWSWQHANDRAWDTIRNGPAFLRKN